MTQRQNNINIKCLFSLKLSQVYSEDRRDKKGTYMTQRLKKET